MAVHSTPVTGGAVEWHPIRSSIHLNAGGAAASLLLAFIVWVKHHDHPICIPSHSRPTLCIRILMFRVPCVRRRVCVRCVRTQPEAKVQTIETTRIEEKRTKIK